MLQDIYKAIWIIVPVALITVVLEAARLILGAKTGEPPMFSSLLGYVIGSVIFAALATLVFRWVQGNWSQAAPNVYLSIALGAALILTVAAFGMHFALKSAWSDVAVWTLMNVTWGVGYGVFLPKVLA